jgi:hypothetical protein
MEGAASAVHVAEIALVRRADAATVFLLAATVGINVAIVIVEFGFADGHPLV